MKDCTKCGEAKPLEDFPPDKQNSDGRKGKCRACVLQRQRELRAANPEKERDWVRKNHDRVLAQKAGYRERNADRLRAEGRERGRRSRSTDEGRERHNAQARAAQKRARERNPSYQRQKRITEGQKVRAREALSRALKRGRVVKPPACEACGRSHALLHGHHEDYMKPLDVRWLCPRCHKARHVEIEAAAKALVAA